MSVPTGIGNYPPGVTDNDPHFDCDDDLPPDDEPRDGLLLKLRATDPHLYPLQAAEAMLQAADEIEWLRDELRK